MNLTQSLALVLLCVFYASYLIKMLALRQRGIAGNLLGKGNKPAKEKMIETALSAATLIGAVVQFASALYAHIAPALVVSRFMHVTGLVLMTAGSVFFMLALAAMKLNWRAGYNDEQHTQLVTRGVYQISRNPAFVGFDLLYIGCAFALPNLLNIAAAIFAVVLFHVQILGEERYCERAFGQVYANYQSRVRRYL